MQRGEPRAGVEPAQVRWILETPRLMLRELREHDAHELLRLHSHRQVMRYVCEPVWDSLEHAHEALRADEAQRGHGCGLWVCIDKGSGRFVGVIGLTRLPARPEQSAPPEQRETELAYRFFPEDWRQGLATETCRAVLAYAFVELGLERVSARVLADNLASIRVLEKVGMRQIDACHDAEARLVWRYLVARGDSPNSR